MAKNYAVSLICLLFLSSYALGSSWHDKQYKFSLDRIQKHLQKNDTPKGFVIAADSKVNPPYYFHWVRDGGLVMDSLFDALPWVKKKKAFDAYVDLVLKHQSARTLSGLGEPKFNLDGTGYSGDWGRPQNDGPALRAIVLTKFANELLKWKDRAYVKDKLYYNEIPANTAIKRDLEYVAHHWKDPNFDLWEEVKGEHFYTKMVQREAMIMGARLAKKLGDTGASTFYSKTAKEISKSIESHWDKNKNYINTTIHHTADEGLKYKHSNLDASVILAVNHTYKSHQQTKNESFDVLDPRVHATFIKIVRVFQKDYSINSRFTGTAIGRYPEDQYYKGNPWFLITTGFGEFLMNLRQKLHQEKEVKITATNQDFYRYVLNDKKVKIGILTSGSPIYLKIQKELELRALEFIARVKKHADPSGQMDEQFDKNSGYMLGAQHLTWSYAAYLTFYKAWKDYGKTQFGPSGGRR